jgi:purine-cytosine permease-like protein
MAGAIQEKSNTSADSAIEQPRLERRALAMAWWGICSAMFYLVVAAALALGYGTVNALIGLILSVICYGLINSFLTRHAIASGLSVAEFSQILFGRKGATLATLIFSATAIYYGVFEGSVMAVALHHFAPGVSLNAAFLLVAIYSVLLVAGNAMRWLDKLNAALLPLYLLGIVAAVVMAVHQYGYSNAWLDLAPASGPVPQGWWNCFTYFMGVWVFMMYTWDYARFGKPKDSDFHARFTFGTPFYAAAFLFNGIVGIFLAATIPTEGGITEVSVVLGIVQLMGLAGFLFVWVTQTRINTGNFFLAASNLHALTSQLGMKKVPYTACAIAAGVIAYLMMLVDVFSYILQALAYQSLFIVGWVAIAMAHLISAKSVRYKLENTPALRARGLLTWLVSCVVGIWMHLSTDTTLATASAPAVFIIAFAGYLVAPRLRRAQPYGDPA